MNRQSLSKIKSVFKFLNDKLAFLQDPETFRSKKPASQEKIQQRIDDFVSKEAEYQAEQKAVIREQDKINVDVDKKLNFLERAIEDLKQSEKTLLSDHIVPILTRLEDITPDTVKADAERIQDIAGDYSTEDLQKANLRYNAKTGRFHENDESNRMVSFESAKLRLEEVKPLDNVNKEDNLLQNILDNFISINSSFNNVIKLMMDQFDTKPQGVPVGEEPKKTASIFKRIKGPEGGLASFLGFLGFAFSPYLLKLLLNPKDLENKINDGIKFFRDDLPEMFGNFLQKELLGKITGKDFLIGLGLLKLAPAILPVITGFVARTLLFFTTPAGLAILAGYYVGTKIGDFLNQAVERGNAEADEQQKARDKERKANEESFVSKASQFTQFKSATETQEQFTARIREMAPQLQPENLKTLNDKLQKLEDAQKAYGPDTQRADESIEQFNARLKGKRQTVDALRADIESVLSKTGGIAGPIREENSKSSLELKALQIQMGMKPKTDSNESPQFTKRLETIQKKYDALSDDKKAELKKQAQSGKLSKDIYGREVQVEGLRGLDATSGSSLNTPDASPVAPTVETPNAQPITSVPVASQTESTQPSSPGFFGKLANKVSSIGQSFESLGERLISAPSATSGDTISTATSEAKPKPQSKQPIVIRQPSTSDGKDVSVKPGNPLSINEVLDPTPVLGNLSNQLFAPAM